jgi:hypothetical protein
LILEPDVGMPEYLAQHYFKQVVAGMVEIDEKNILIYSICFRLISIVLVWRIEV